MSIGAISSGLAGMQSYQRMVDGGASKVASSSVADNSGDVAGGLIQGVQGKDGFMAAAKVVKSANEMIGSLIDTTA